MDEDLPNAGAVFAENRCTAAARKANFIMIRWRKCDTRGANVAVLHHHIWRTSGMHPNMTSNLQRRSDFLPLKILISPHSLI
jgi:hypothetical protein